MCGGGGCRVGVCVGVCVGYGRRVCGVWEEGVCRVCVGCVWGGVRGDVYGI